MIHRNCEISIKKSVRYWSKKVNVLYNKHNKMSEKYRDSEKLYGIGR